MTDLKFEVYKASDGWRWRLIASNGEIIASGEGYAWKDDCLHAIELVQRSGSATVELLT